LNDQPAFRSAKRCAYSKPKSSVKSQKRSDRPTAGLRDRARRRSWTRNSSTSASSWRTIRRFAPPSRARDAQDTMLNFPNDSRSFDRTRRAVRFWGYESSMEASFFVTEAALKGLQPNMQVDEEGMLDVFDSNRDRIYATAAKVYARGRKGSYDLERSDF
jgi:hypothetical protein